MRFLLCAALFAIEVVGQVPAQDARNTNVPNTNTHFTMRKYKTLEEWEARKDHLRKQILSAAGLLPMPEKKPLRPQIFDRIIRKDYLIEKVLLETLPGYYLGGNLYRPVGKPGKLPAVASPHGHWPYGRLENTSLVSVPARCISLARQGYVVFTYDQVGHNDTIQTPHDFSGPTEQLWSFNPLGLQLWNSIRVVDFLLALDEVDGERIAATGASSGATQTFLLAAIDDRVKYSAPVSMISAFMQGGSPCTTVPSLNFGTFNVEIAALTAPRPMLIVSNSGDWTRNTPHEEFPAIREIYELYGKGASAENVHIEASHNYNQASREAVYRFLGKHMLGETDSSKFSEANIRVEQPKDFLVLHGRTLPSDALSYKDIFEHWKAASRRQTAETQDLDVLRERVRYSLAAEWPDRVLHEIDGENIVLSRVGRNDRVPGLWMEGQGRNAALVTHPEGAQIARNTLQVRELLQSKHSVLLLNVFQTGTTVAPRDESRRDFLTYNRSDDANRVQDILTGLKFLSSQPSGRIELVGLEHAAVWCLFAAAISPLDLELQASLDGFEGGDEDFLTHFFVPGIQRAGGLEAALRLTASQR